MNFKKVIKCYLIFVGLLLVGFLKAQTQFKTQSASSVTYAVVSIPYSPWSYSTGIQILANQDDIWSDTLSVGFNFNYFGKTYNTFIAGSNGQISFDTSKATGSDNWSISVPIPSMADMPGNTICAAFRDIDPTSSGVIYYSTYGSIPNRYLVVSWGNIPVFSNPGSCTGIPNTTFQLVLHETTNCIDVFVKNSTTCPGWNSGKGIIGIQDSSGTTGYSPLGRNYPSTWTAINEGWRFIPSGSPCGFSTSIHDINETTFKFYPNPSNGIYKMENGVKGNYLEVYNIYGQLLHKQRVTDHDDEIDIRNLENGLYYFKINSSEGKTMYQTKIVKE